MAMPKGGSESGAGALREWRTAQGDKQLYKNVVMGTMLVTQTIKTGLQYYYCNIAHTN